MEYFQWNCSHHFVGLIFHNILSFAWGHGMVIIGYLLFNLVAWKLLCPTNRKKICYLNFRHKWKFSVIKLGGRSLVKKSGFTFAVKMPNFLNLGAKIVHVAVKNIYIWRQLYSNFYPCRIHSYNIYPCHLLFPKLFWQQKRRCHLSRPKIFFIYLKKIQTADLFQCRWNF